MALYTDRSASVYHCPEDDRELWDYFYKIGANYVIAGEPFEQDRIYLKPFLKRHSDNLQEVYNNRDFNVYRIIYNPS